MGGTTEIGYEVNIAANDTDRFYNPLVVTTVTKKDGMGDSPA